MGLKAQGTVVVGGSVWKGGALSLESRRAKLALSSSTGDAEILIGTLPPQTGERNTIASKLSPGS